MTRSFAEWDAHPQGRAVAALPVFTIEQIGDAPPQPLPPGKHPLSGVRVLDLTRVIAGPVCGRTLAAHGADVMLVTARAPAADDAAGDGQWARQALGLHRSARAERGAKRSARLARDADIFVQGYRPGAMRGNGFGARGPGAAAARHRLCVALRLRPRRPVGEPARLRLAGAERERHERRGGGSRRRRAAQAPALSGARSRRAAT